MIQDYLFLSSISRTTAENGRRIVAMNLLPPPSATDSSQGGAQNKQYSANGGGARLTNQQRQRDQLIKQLHYRRFKIMILPEGMARRKANLSGFNPKDKKFGLSVEVKTPAHLDKGKGKTYDTHGAAESEESWMLHKQDSERTLCDVLLSELERRSFASRKEALKARELISPKSSSAPSKASSVGPWIVSSLVLAQAKLPIPSTATLLPPAPAKEGSSQQSQDDAKEIYALHTFPKTEWAIVVPAYSARLTNESTTKYLDWWVRKRKWEEANPELAAQQKVEAKEREGEGQGEGLERGKYGRARYHDNRDRSAYRERIAEAEEPEQGRNRWPDRSGRTQGSAEQAQQVQQQEHESDSPAASAPNETEAAVDVIAAGAGGGGGGGSIVSSSLLSLLSARLGRNQPQPQSQPQTHPSNQKPQQLRPRRPSHRSNRPLPTLPQQPLVRSRYTSPPSLNNPILLTEELTGGILRC